MTETKSEDDGNFIIMDGANELSGVRSMWWLIRHWRALRREMTSTPGYLKHRMGYAFPYTVILTSWWVSEKSAYRFAHSPVHLAFWEWASRNPGNTHGGWLATYRYEKGGPLWGNGVRAMRRGLEGRVPIPRNRDATPTPEDRRRARKLRE